MLDVGCGEGRHTSEICHWDCRAVGVDMSCDDLDVAKLLIGYRALGARNRGRADFLMAVDAQHLPFRDGTFDKIVCTEVLEHIPEDKAGDKRAGARPQAGRPHRRQRARTTGRRWCSGRISWGYWHSPGGHIRFYRPGEMLTALRESGLDIYAQTPAVTRSRPSTGSSAAPSA